MASNNWYRPTRKQIQSHAGTVLLALILLLAFWLRVRGIGFGLPNLYHPDEDAVLMPAINILKTGNFDPLRMEYGTLHIYLLTVVSAIVFILSARNGQIQDTSQLTIFERGTYPSVYQFPEYFIAGRLTSVLMGTGIVLLTYMLARRLGTQRQGLIAATIAAILPALVTHSHYVTTDIPVTFWIMLGLYLLIRAYDNWFVDTMWAYAGAGFVCGLAVSTKYNAILLVLPLLLVPLLRVRTLDKWLTLRVLIGPIAMLAGFLVGTPFALLNLPKFLYWFGYSLRLYNAPRELLIPVWQWHLNYHLTSPHAIIIVLGLGGFIVSFFQWGRRALIVNSFVFVLFGAVFSQTNAQARMWIPSAPIIIIWAALALDWTIHFLETRLSSGRKRIFISYAPLIVLVPLLVTSIQYGTRFQQEDIRTLAQRWVKENVPPGTAIAVDYMHPNLNPDVWPITRLFSIFDKEPEWFAENGIEYLIMNESRNDFDKYGPEAYARYQRLMANSCLVETIQGPILASGKFDIKIYRLGACQQ